MRKVVVTFLRIFGLEPRKVQLPVSVLKRVDDPERMTMLEVEEALRSQRARLRIIDRDIDIIRGGR